MKSLSEDRSPETLIYFLVVFGGGVPLLLASSFIFPSNLKIEEIVVPLFSFLYILAFGAYFYLNRDLSIKGLLLGIWEILWVGILIGPTWPLIHFVYLILTWEWM
jgi:hypothetical protein